MITERTGLPLSGSAPTARAFVTRQLPLLYEQGAQQAAEALGGRFTWTLIHAEALQSLASDSYADFLRRSQEEQSMAAAFYRAVREAVRRLRAAGSRHWRPGTNMAVRTTDWQDEPRLERRGDIEVPPGRDCGGSVVVLRWNGGRSQRRPRSDDEPRPRVLRDAP